MGLEFKTTLKFGLNEAKSNTTTTTTTTTTTKKKKKNLLSNAFGCDDSSEEDNNNNNDRNEMERAKRRHNEEIKRQQDAIKSRVDRDMEEVYTKALEEDPLAFSYDEALDTIQEKRQQKLKEDDGEKIERKSRYIEQLKEAAELRKREQDVTYERKLLKEREKEDELFGEKDKFITQAYRKKLEEDEKWKKEMEEREEREKERDVHGKSDMTSFYANLMNRNVSTGGDTATHSRKAPEISEDRRRHHTDADDNRTTKKDDDVPASVVNLTSTETTKVINEVESRKEERCPTQQISANDFEEKQKRLEMTQEDKAKAARERYLARKRKDPPVSF